MDWGFFFALGSLSLTNGFDDSDQDDGADQSDNEA